MTLTKLKLARLRSGLRQWDVALAAGVSESQFSKFETGRKEPDAVTLSKIADALGVRPEELAGSEVASA